MISLILSRSVEEYKKNFFVCISFAVLFLFAVIFALPYFSGQFFVSSGTEFLAFNYAFSSIAAFIIGIIFLYAFSFFISLIIYSVHRDVQTFSIDTYWGTLMRNSALKIFFLYLILAIIFYVLLFAGTAFSFPQLALFVCLIITLLFMYAPQSIVLDEVGVIEGISNSISFWSKNFVTSVVIVILLSILLFVLMAVEFALELFGLPGALVSFILVLLFLVPFSEQMKSYAFVLKYALIRTSEVHQSRHYVRKHSPQHRSSTRLHEHIRGGKL